jgi:hypothetical protein
MKHLTYFLLISAIFISSCGKTKKNVLPIILDQKNNKTANVIIPAVNENATLTSISVAPALVTIAQNTHANYTATGIYSDNSQRDLTAQVTWTSNTTNASVVSSTSGAFLGSSVGEGTITASYETLSGNANIAITNASLSSIQVSANPTVPSGTVVTYTAIGLFSDGTTQNISNLVTWSSSNTSAMSIAEGGKATSSQAGSTTITATAGAALNNRTASTNTQVTSVSLVSISITGLDSIFKNGTSNYKAIGVYSDGTKIDITSLVSWSSSVSSIGNVSDDSNFKGLFSAIAVGSTNLVATLNGISGTKAVSVIQTNIASISVQPTTATIPKNYNRQYQAIATLSDASLVNITNQAIWSSSNNSIAGVATSTTTGGLATGVSSGSVTLTASLGGISGTASLSVTNASLVSINIGSNISVNLNSTKQLTATGTFSDGSTLDITNQVTWLSNNSNIAFISNTSGSKGLVSGNSSGTVNIQASLFGTTSNIIQASVIGQISGNNAILPDGYIAGTTPSGSFNGITYSGGTDVAGFIASVPDRGTTSCTALGSAILGIISADTTNISASNLISSNSVGTAPNCSALYELGVTTTSNRTPTQLSNRLIETIGVNSVGGVVSSLPSSTGTATNDFRVLIQATYSSTGSEIIGVGVSSESNYPANQATLTNFLNGTNIRNANAVYTAKTDSFTGTADPKVDFLWVVDNSGSMSTEQAAVSNNSVTFFNKLGNKHLDFRLGVIATGGTGSNKCSFTAATQKGHELFGTGWTTSTNGSSAFQSNVNAVGIAGCGDETGIYSAERALGGHAGVSATVVPRTGSKLVMVILSDEGDYYECYNGGSKNGDGNGASPCNNGPTPFSFTNNIFKNNDYKVYTITGLSANGQPGTCSDTSSGTAADSGNNAFNYYYQLAQTTGGSSASICNSDYSAILDNIVNNAAANSSTYELAKIPVSTSIVVKKNGVVVSQNSSNGWLYNASANSIVFSGTAWPNPGDSIEVSYTYDANVTSGSALTAFIANVTNSSTTMVALIFLLIAGSIFGFRQFSKKNQVA